jgi:hypothetical protein
MLLHRHLQNAKLGMALIHKMTGQFDKKERLNVGDRPDAGAGAHDLCLLPDDARVADGKAVQQVHKHNHDEEDER